MNEREVLWFLVGVIIVLMGIAVLLVYLASLRPAP